MTQDSKLEAADAKVEGAADKLQQVADKAAAEGGLKAKVAPMLAEDADFLRRLKPSRIVARAKGDAPTNARPGETVVAPSGPQLGARRNGDGKGNGGPSPFLVVGVALVVGVVLAKVVDWRSHAHPRF